MLLILFSTLILGVASDKFQLTQKFSSFTDLIKNFFVDIFGYIFSLIHKFREQIATGLIQIIGGFVPLPPGTGFPVPELIRVNGYPAEVHDVVTQDGYILQLHRIPYGKNRTTGNMPNKKVVFLMPGLASSSACFVWNTEKNNLAYLLANKGYDVWIGNGRGTRYSQRHVNSNISRADFFKFSIHEVGVYDIPANLEYILKATGQRNLYYVGYSQGTSDIFIALAERPEYNNKIRLLVALAPMTYMEHTPHDMMRYLSKISFIFIKFLEMFGVYDIFTAFPEYKVLAVLLCNDYSPFQKLCEAALQSMGSQNWKEANMHILPTILTNFPEGSSIYTVDHYAQMLKTKKFQRYDYGSPTENLLRYSENNTSEYKISNIKCPVAFLYGPSDQLSHPKDISRFAGELPNLISNTAVDDLNFQHLDFVTAKHADVLVNAEVHKLISSY